MKTRKILALLLAILMIGGMLPTAFAADAAESVSVTYSFYKGGRSDVASDWLENFTWTPAAEILDGNTEYAIERNADYMAFPESSENPNDQWAYVGSGMGRSASYVTPTTGKGTVIGLNSDLNSEGNPGFGFINTYTGGSGSWIAFKIKVPETALYKISGVTAFAYSNASSNIGVYVVPVADELAETVTAAAASGSFSATAYTGTSTSYQGKYLVYRNNFTTFANLGIDSDYLMGKTNIYEASGNNYSSERDVTSINAQTLEADKEYYLFLQADSGAMTIKSITLTETTAEAEAVTNPVFTFGLSSFKDVASIKDSGGYARLFNATSYNYIDTSVSSGRWAYVNNFYMTNNLVESDDVLFCAKDLEHNAIVLKLEVGKSGIYQPTLDFKKNSYSGKLNIWTIPATEDVSKYTGYTQAYDLIEKAQYIGSVDLHTDSSDAAPFVGNDVYMQAGDNYLIMTITKGAGDTTNDSSLYYAYIKSLALERKAGVVLSAEKKELIKGRATTLSAYVADADNNPLDASVTYESLNPTVATVDNATGIVTAVSVGTATIKATAVTANGTYTDTIEITVNTKWDMTYIFTNSVVASQTGTAANPPLNTVTALKDDVTDSWEYVNQIGLGAGGLYSDGIQYQCYPSAFLDDGENKNVIVLKLNFPETGTYLPTLGAMRRTYCGKNDIYLVPKSYADSKWNMSSSALPIAEIVSDAGVTNIISANLYHSSNESTPKLFEGDTYNVDENEIYMIIVLRNNDENIINDGDGRLWGYPRYLEMTRTGSVKLLADKTELTKGDTTTLITAIKDNRDNAATADVTLTSLNTAVATVSGNTVTAVAPGTATIKATATVDGVEVSDTVEITVGAETADNMVSFAAYSSIAGESVSVSGIIYDEEVESVSRGTPITVVAPEVEGYTFRYWKRGSSTNGKWISNDSTYSFSLMTNTMLTAVYDENVEAEGKKVEFWNQNGTYLETKTVTDGEFEAPTATLTGFTFKGWYVNGKDKLDVSKLTAAITRAVAQYDANAISGSVTVGGEPESEIVYNKKITKTVPGATVWKRDQKPVAYGETYTYYVWDATDITCETAAISEKEPLIIIESGNGGAFMIEYDAGDKQIVEAGIVFGDGATVDVCQAKATSQKNLSHGQFTATSDYSAARGYIIYKDNGNYIVKYSD